MIDELGVFPHNASNCSLLIVGDLVYSCTSNGQDWTHSNIPSPNAPSLDCAEQKHRRIRRRRQRPNRPAHFPRRMEFALGGGRQRHANSFSSVAATAFCYAFDPTPVKEGDDSAYLRRSGGTTATRPNAQERLSNTGAEGPSEINATPVFWKNRVYVAVGQDPEHGEGVGIINCIDATKTGDITKTGKIWSYDKIHRSLSTVSITPEGLLFVGDFSGFLHCLDAETGQLYWTHDLKAHIWGSTLVADGKVYIGDEDGDLEVFAASKEKKLISVTNLGAPVYSTPVAANGVLYVSSNTHLFAFASDDQSRSADARLKP